MASTFDPTFDSKMSTSYFAGVRLTNCGWTMDVVAVLLVLVALPTVRGQLSILNGKCAGSFRSSTKQADKSGMLFQSTLYSLVD